MNTKFLCIIFISLFISACSSSPSEKEIQQEKQKTEQQKSDEALNNFFDTSKLDTKPKIKEVPLF